MGQRSGDPDNKNPVILSERSGSIEEVEENLEPNQDMNAGGLPGGGGGDGSLNEDLERLKNEAWQRELRKIGRADGT